MIVSPITLIIGPLVPCSVGREDAEYITFEERGGGHVIERIRGKRLVVWGTALLWNRPPVLSVSWHPGPDENTDKHWTRILGRSMATRASISHMMDGNDWAT